MRCIRIVADSYTEDLRTYLISNNQVIAESGKGSITVARRDSVYECISSYIWDKCIYDRIRIKLGDKYEDCIRKAIRIIRKPDDYVYCHLSIYLRGNDHFNLSGFVSFRLQVLLQDIVTIAELCIEEAIYQKEYNDFILLLRSYVVSQIPEVDRVHFTVDKYGDHHIYNCEGDEITYKYLTNLSYDIEYAKSDDDLIITSLITIAPNIVYMHNEQHSNNPNLIQTVKSIFAGRTICCCP